MMTISFTNIQPANGQQVSRTGTLAFTLSSDLGVGVRVSIYSTRNDVEEFVWDGLSFVGSYRKSSLKAGDDFIIRRHGGLPPGGVSLRVSEIGSTATVSIWADGTGIPSNSLGDDGDYYLDTATGGVYKKATGTYSLIFIPTVPTGAPSIGIGAGNVEGVAATYARSDHGHALRFGSEEFTLGAIVDGEFLRRAGTTIISEAVVGGGPYFSEYTLGGFTGGVVTDPGDPPAIPYGGYFAFDINITLSRTSGSSTYAPTITLQGLTSGAKGQMGYAVTTSPVTTAGITSTHSVFNSVSVIGLASGTTHNFIMHIMGIGLRGTGAFGVSLAASPNVYTAVSQTFIHQA